MKKIVIIFVFFMLLITSAISGSAILESKNNDNTVSFLDDVPVWNIGDSWTYTIKDFTVDYQQEGQRIYFNGGINDFKLTVRDTSGPTYTVDFTGKLNCGYSIYLTTSNGLNLYLIGSMRQETTRLQGTVIFTKSNLNVRDISGQISGITMAKIDPLPFAIPIPYKATIQGDLSTDFPLFNFPLSTNKFWELPAMTIQMKMNVGGIFGFIQIPITFTTQYGWTPLAFHCRGKQSVTVEAGTYNAWEIQSTFFDLFRYYYAPEIGTVVKIDANMANGSVSAELSSTNV
ncbi:MAG: hypothetical protein R6V50_02555 [Thermoplasmatota archaeon]